MHPGFNDIVDLVELEGFNHGKTRTISEFFEIAMVLLSDLQNITPIGRRLEVLILAVMDSDLYKTKKLAYICIIASTPRGCSPFVRKGSFEKKYSMVLREPFVPELSDILRLNVVCCYAKET